MSKSLFNSAKENDLERFATLISNLRRMVFTLIYHYVEEDLDLDPDISLKSRYEFIDCQYRDVLQKHLNFFYVIDDYEVYDIMITIKDKRIYDLEEFDSNMFELKKQDYNEMELVFKSKGQQVVDNI